MSDPLAGLSQLLVGHQWPGEGALTTTESASKSRAAVGTEHESYADSLQSIRLTHLAGQEGNTARDVNTSFSLGESGAREIAGRNRTKAGVYGTAYQSAHQLRMDLKRIADLGESDIRALMRSNAPLEQKISAIVDVVVEAQEQANIKAAQQAGNILDAMQSLLNDEGIGISAREFTQQQGVSLHDAFRSINRDHIRAEVMDLLRQMPKAPVDEESLSRSVESRASRADDSAPSGAQQQDLSAANSSSTGSWTTTWGGNPLGHGGPAGTETASGNTQLSASVALAGNAIPAGPSAGTNAPVNPPLPTTGPAAGAPTPTPFSTSASSTGTASAPQSAAVGLSSTDVSQQPVTPAVHAPAIDAAPKGFGAHVNAGNHTGAPASAVSEAFTTTITNTTHTSVSPTTPFTEMPLQTSAAPILETAHAPATPVEIAPIPTESPQPVIAPTLSPVLSPSVPAPAVNSVTATPPAAPQGPLPAYGADLRPPTTASPLPAAPASAPVSPAAGPGSTAQSAVMRQSPPVYSPSAVSAARMTERAVATAATGSVAGAANARRNAESRLRRLLTSVAHQYPQLHWAIADLEDGSTLLVTDLAGGWVPSDVEIPVGVRLLPPAARRGEPAALLGAHVLAAEYRPGQYLASTDTAVSMSVRARDLPAVDDLRWELSQATKWRDGLPQLAHTLAKAASARTGLLDIEVDLLRAHLTAVAGAVLGSYPNSVIQNQVGNWQLLSTIDALARGQQTLANYHLAWFLASEGR